jgi:tetratricopeptide (TPR) repeat protein
MNATSSSLRAALAALVLAAGAAGAAMADETVADPVAAAMDAFKKGEYEKAAEVAAAVPAEDPARLKAAYVVGEASLALEKWVSAEKAFQEILAKKPESVPAMVGLGRAQTGAGDFALAIETLEKAVKKDPKDASARRALGDARVAKGDTEKGRTDLEAAVKLDPKDPSAARSLVELFIKASKVNDAEKEALRLAKALPEHPMGHFLVGWVLDRKGGAEKEAIAAYERAIAKDERFLDAHKNLAILCVTRNPGYADKARTDKAMEHFKKYFELGGKDQDLKDKYEQMKEYVASQKGDKTK